MILFWILVFVASSALLVKSADWLLGSAERIGLAVGLSPFIVGVVIVGAGTSFPELISAIVAIIEGAPEIVAANAIGSNISNILLVVGIAAILGKRLIVTRSLVDIELPLLAASTVLFLGVAWDGEVVLVESILLVVAFGIYLLYSIVHKEGEEDTDEDVESLPNRVDRRGHQAVIKGDVQVDAPIFAVGDVTWLIVSAIGLVVGAKYLVDSVVVLSGLLGIATGAITLTAVALGTSLPELLVSARAAMEGKSEVALGNIFGSNAFNLLLVVGLPGLFRSLPLDDATLTIGLPALGLATLLFIISGISHRMYVWEGAFYLSLYVLFVGKLFMLF